MKKILSVLLAAIMSVQLLSFNAFGENGETAPVNIVQVAVQDYLDAIGETELTADNVFGSGSVDGILVKTDTGYSSSIGTAINAINGINNSSTDVFTTATGKSKTRQRVSINLQGERIFDKVVFYEYVGDAGTSKYSAKRIYVANNYDATKNTDTISNGIFLGAGSKNDNCGRFTDAIEPDAEMKTETVSGGVLKHTVEFTSPVSAKYVILDSTCTADSSKAYPPSLMEIEVYHNIPAELLAINVAEDSEEMKDAIEDLYTVIENDEMWAAYDSLDDEEKIFLAEKVLEERPEMGYEDFLSVEDEILFILGVYFPPETEKTMLEKINEATNSTEIMGIFTYQEDLSDDVWYSYNELAPDEKEIVAAYVLSERPDEGYESILDVEEKIVEGIDSLQTEETKNIVQVATQDYLESIGASRLTADNVFGTEDIPGMLVKSDTGYSSTMGDAFKFIDGINNNTDNYFRTATGTSKTRQRYSLDLQKKRLFNTIVFYEYVPEGESLYTDIKISVANEYELADTSTVNPDLGCYQGATSSVALMNFPDKEDLEDGDFVYSCENVSSVILKHTFALNNTVSKKYVVISTSCVSKFPPYLMELELYYDKPEALIAINTAEDNEQMKAAIDNLFDSIENEELWSSYDNLEEEEKLFLAEKVLGVRPDVGYEEFSVVEEIIEKIISKYLSGVPQKTMLEMINEATTTDDILEELTSQGEISDEVWTIYTALEPNEKTSVCAFVLARRPSAGYATISVVEEQIIEGIDALHPVVLENIIQTATLEYLNSLKNDAETPEEWDTSSINADNIFGTPNVPGIIVENETGSTHSTSSPHYSINSVNNDTVDRFTAKTNSGYTYHRLSLNLQRKRAFNKVVVYEYGTVGIDELTLPKTNFESWEIAVSDSYVDDGYEFVGNDYKSYSAFGNTKIFRDGQNESEYTYTCEPVGNYSKGVLKHTILLDESVEKQYLSFQTLYTPASSTVSRIMEIELYYQEPKILSKFNSCADASEVMAVIETHKDDVFKDLYEEYSELSEDEKSEIASELIVIRNNKEDGKFYLKSDLVFYTNILIKKIKINKAQTADEIADVLSGSESIFNEELWTKYSELLDGGKLMLSQFVLSERDNQTNQQYADFDAVFAVMHKYLGVVLVSGAGADKVKEVLLEYKDIYGLDYSVVNTFSEEEQAAFYLLLDNRTYSSIEELQQAFALAVTEIMNPSDEEQEDEGNMGNIGNVSGGGISSGGGGGNAGGSSDKKEPEKTTEENPAETTEPTEKETFSDLDTVNWAKDDIAYLAKEGIISTETEKFRPADSVSREEMIKMIVLGFDLYDEDAKCSFTDVSADRWSYKYVASAVENGICNGISEELFGSDDSLTREDAAVLLYRLIGITEMKFEETGETANFADDENFSDYSRESINKMKSYGIIQGRGDNMFAPKGNITRAEAAKLIATLRRLWKK